MKKIHISVFLKIWVSIGILIVGYFLSVAIIYNTGTRLKKEFTYLESVVFPAAIISQNIVSDFQKQVKQYEDAIVIGEANLLDRASETSESIRTEIQSILSLQGLQEDKIRKLKDILTQLDEFTKSASTIYHSMMGKELGDIGETAQQQISNLAKKKEILSLNINDLASGFTNELKSNIRSSLILICREGYIQFLIIMPDPRKEKPSMNHNVFYAKCLFVSVFIIVLSVSAVPAQEMLIICNKNVPQNALSRDELQQIFLGRKTRWQDDQKINFAILKSGDVHQDFLKKMLDKTPSQYEAFWKKLIFSGQGKAPVSINTPEEILSYVASTPGAISYVPPNLSQENIKVVPVKE